MCICIVAALRQCKYMEYNGRWAQEWSLIFLARVPKCVQAGVLHLGAVRQACSVKLASLPVYAICFGAFTTRKSSRNVHKSFREAIVKSPFAGFWYTYAVFGWPSKGFVRPSKDCKRRFLCASWIIASPQETPKRVLGGSFAVLYSPVALLQRKCTIC